MLLSISPVCLGTSITLPSPDLTVWWEAFELRKRRRNTDQ